jgi:predicted permease
VSRRARNLEGEIGVPDELYVQFRESADRLEDIGMYGLFQSTTRVENRVERLFGLRATPSVFTTLGARPVLGRLPTDEDNDGVVVISHWLWTDWFGSDESVLNRSYEFAGATRTVIGVMGPEFRFPDERVALWIPWRVDPAALTPGGFGGRIVARMTPGTDFTGLISQLTPLTRRLLERFPGPPPYVRIIQQYQPLVRSLEEELVGPVKRPLWILMGAVAIVLLMACANVANLFMVRAERRRQAFAVRRALGSGRGGLVRSQMAEALLLAAIGGVGGALIAWAGAPLLVRAAPESITSGWGGAPIPRLANVGIDPAALAFTAGISILAACLFGLLPAIRVSRVGLLETLRQGGRGVIGRQHLGRDALVVLQTASALVLLVGSALLVRSFMQLRQVDPGYDTKNIFTFQIAPEREELNDRPSWARFHYAFMARLADIPGVESVGTVATLPLDEGAGEGFVHTERTEASRLEAPLLRITATGGEYFRTMGIDLVRGRYFERSDEAPGMTNVVVSRAAADLLWPGEDPIGQRIRPSEGQTWFQVVGVVEDVLLDDFRKTPDPMVYLPQVVGSPAYVVRSARANVIAPEIRELIREVVPESPMYRVFTMEELAARSMASLSFTMWMVAVAAALALILGAAGLYGVLSYVVSQRTREIGIRMALGAEASALRRMVVAQGGRVALTGIVVGVIAAVMLTRVLENLLFGVEPVDPFTILAMTGVMLAIALLASYIPARQASSVDPLRSLRAE